MKISFMVYKFHFDLKGQSSSFPKVLFLAPKLPCKFSGQYLVNAYVCICVYVTV